MKHIVITGGDGTGKSTHCKFLQGHLKVPVAISSPWDALPIILKVNSNFKFDSRDGIQLYLSQCSSKSRAFFLYHCVSRAYQACVEKGPQLIISDGYWYKYAVSEACYGNDFDKLVQGAALFDPPDEVIYLKLDENIALARKTTISRYERGGAQEEVDVQAKFLEGQRKMQFFWNKLIKKDWHVVDANQSLEQVQSEVLQLVEKILCL
ncbi:MAG: hypothetical protein A2504_07995 [Bdellovibrionales bacterium RIFOXYD12_FULL_39_22]|nr:MAG: hypothetical protein A2385_13620 [Bdellovibrionales bacterium RIFOXYB1_FULL_39_21]OFZ44872.1 MAG: hypothetical protein A2485_14830 [Bdellovibrionales bacterium RIFOXYC12_FULL_39_17]OFZ49390.1 MAG: hypothetical protein A2404_09165 [Bdellovibrionales bacterium RIFOXYC1_FULL_39_130]OFZ77111.1 MAG: hypothetical protein A2560_10815 [Bdellovibrionales bacterium RIFOXYD1_FULL_39_84]OFZ95572.1 MAG: hypothetical protein A2504_07995 [Bdellovibrionales bacterium RIFOXYD12_FULL_39_22]